MGGYDVMVLGALVAGAVLGLIGWVLARRLGIAGWTAAGFVWTVVVIALVTLIPADADPGVVLAEDRLAGCSFDIGGPAPDGFWIFSGGQRLLNTVAFVPSGAFLVLTAARWRSAWLTVPVGLVGLAGYSVAIEAVQLGLARIDRACDATDVIDNVTGAVVGVGVGLLLALVVRPWRDRHERRRRAGQDDGQGVGPGVGPG